MFSGKDNTKVKAREELSVPPLAHFPKKGLDITSLNKQLAILNKSRKSGAEIVKAKLMLLVSHKLHRTLNDFLIDPYVGDSFGAMLASLYGIVDEITVVTSGLLQRYTLAILKGSSPDDEGENAALLESDWLEDYEPLFNAFSKRGVAIKQLKWFDETVIESDAYEVQTYKRKEYEADPNIQKDLQRSAAAFLDRLKSSYGDDVVKREGVDKLVTDYLLEEFIGVVTRMRLLFKPGYMGSVYANGESDILKRARTVALEQIEKKNSIPDGRMVFWGWYKPKHQQGSLTDPRIKAKQQRYRKPPVEVFLKEQFPGVSFDQPLTVDQLVKARKIFVDYALNAFDYGLFVSEVKDVGIVQSEFNGSTKSMLARLGGRDASYNSEASSPAAHADFLEYVIRTFKINGAAGTATLSQDGSLQVTYHGPARPPSPPL